MRKKRAAIPIITVLLCMLCVLQIAVNGCKKSDTGSTDAQNVSTAVSDEARYIFTEKGLNLREKPDENSKKIDIIGFGEKVNVISEEKDEIFLMGEYGKWTQVSWKDKTGWVFGGYIRSHDPFILKKTAAEHYNAVWKKYIEDWFKKHGEGRTLTKEIMKRYNQTEKDMKIEAVLGDFAVINHWTDDMQGDVTSFENSSRSDLWKYDDGKWTECKMIKSNFVPDPEVKGASVSLFYLNEDRFPDYIAYGGCCDSVDVFIMLGRENKTFENVSEYHETGFNCSIVQGRCGKASLILSSGEEKKTYWFDCKTDRFNLAQ